MTTTDITSSFLNNIILLCDSYKVTHYNQYPPGTEFIYSYFESRGGRFDKVLFFGLQYILKRNLVGRVVTAEKIEEAKSIIKTHFKRDLFNEAGWRYILEHHNGHLPLLIKAVPEGRIIPTRNVLFTVENTDPACYWLTNYIETILVQVWYPMTVATNSHQMKSVLWRYLMETSDNFDCLKYMLHDFGFRGVSSVESAAIGGAAHLVNFMGTDTLAALLMAKQYYHCPMAGHSIPATEHSSITVWGEAMELQAYSHLLDIYPSGTFACVADSYDLWRACENVWGKALKDKVVNRQGTVVIRPDSGEPTEIVPKVLDILGSKFGYSVNSKGFKLFPPCIRVIQGDGISLNTLSMILDCVKAGGWSVENISFGSGGALLQQFNRDTQKCAFKCSFAIVNGKPIDVCKHPITDPQKTSKKGRLILEYNPSSDDYRTVEHGCGDETKDILIPVFLNGSLLRDYTFDEIRLVTTEYSPWSFDFGASTNNGSSVHM